MASAKDIIVKVIPADKANEFVREHHYSGSVVQNSTLHFGCFLHNRLHGVMSFGNSIDKRKVMDFVKGTGWNEFIELNCLAFDDYLPKNSESRCIAIAVKLIKKHAPQIKWILSYADGTQCGDGTIYRASGFYLCGINPNNTIHRLANGKVKAKHGTSKVDFTGSERLEGFQLRYIYLIDKTCVITVPILPYSAIAEAGAKMYKGVKCVGSGNASGVQPEVGGSIPTPTLQKTTEESPKNG